MSNINGNSKLVVNVYTCTVKRVLRGHLWDKDKVVF